MENVTLKQLRAMLSLAKERSFTKVGAKLNVSQSALTLQIRALESEVGAKLFDHTTRSVELTPQGAEFHPMVELVIDQLAFAIVDELRGLKSNSKLQGLVDISGSLAAFQKRFQSALRPR